MDAKTLRASILQMAIEGKLVPQSDKEPAVEQIGDAPDEVPFEIPGKWKWAHLGDIGRWKAGGTPSRSNLENYANGTIPWLKTGDLTDSTINTVSEYISEVGLENSSAHINAVGSVLIAMYGATIGKIGLLTFPCATNQACCACETTSKLIYNWYLFYYLLSQRKGFIAQGAGGAQPNISKTKIVNYLIPVPPVAEQRRIVSRLNELLPVVDKFGKAQEALAVAQKEFPEKLKASLLQEAIQGKLVPQLNEEPAVEQIGEAPEDVPFTIPEKWKWVRLSAVGKIVGGGTPKTSCPEYWDGDIPWITPADLGKQRNKKIARGAKNITQLGLDNSSAKLMPAGAVVYSSRAPIGYTAIAQNPLCTNQGCKSLVPDLSIISTEWGYWCLIARTTDIVSRASGTTFKEISGKGVGESWIPLPPLAEQHRIVARLNELLPLVTQMATAIAK